MPGGQPQSSNSRVVHALSVDVEEHFQVEAFANNVTTADWQRHASRVVANTERVLEVFARHRVRATFFIVGWVAERNAALVRQILAAGHEIGCHSHMHRALWHLTPEQFRADLKRALATIQEITGVAVRGFRAPTFSIVQRTLWALEILASEGIEYDSSVFPVRHDAYGIPDAPRTIYRWRVGDRFLYEFPMTTVAIAGHNLPAGGGGYLRLLPLWYNAWAIRRAERNKMPANVYMHPWEFDPEQPRIEGRLKSRLRHYTNLGKTQGRVEALLQEFEFAPLAEVIAAAPKEANAITPVIAESASVIPG